MSRFSDYRDQLWEKELRRFFGNDLVFDSNQYFRFRRQQSDDTVVIITSDIIDIKGTPVMVVGPQHAVYLKDWLVKRVRSKDGGNAYAVKLNRPYYRIYEFSRPFEDICIDEVEDFDDFVELAKRQDEEDMAIATGWGN